MFKTEYCTCTACICTCNLVVKNKGGEGGGGALNIFLPLKKGEGGILERGAYLRGSLIEDLPYTQHG